MFLRKMVEILNHLKRKLYGATSVYTALSKLRTSLSLGTYSTDNLSFSEEGFVGEFNTTEGWPVRVYEVPIEPKIMDERNWTVDSSISIDQSLDKKCMEDGFTIGEITFNPSKGVAKLSLSKTKLFPRHRREIFEKIRENMEE